VKAAAFDYMRAASLAEACAALRFHGADAKLIAGGQSLVPMMAMRLTRPARLVDINEIAALRYVRDAGDHVATGACTRQCVIERDPVLATRVPLLREALSWVGHVQTRNRGTVGGSLAHADPAAELPLVACILGADLVLRADTGSRSVNARDFFLGPLTSVLEAYECLEEIRWPVWHEPSMGCAFTEVSRRHGDFALVAAGAQIALDESGRCTRASLGLAGGAAVPMAFPALADRLVGSRGGEELFVGIARDVASELDPGGDLHASPGYRRHLAAALSARVLRTAWTQAEQRA